MASSNKEDRPMKEKLRQNYRLVVMNNETFEELGSYTVSLLNVYLWGGLGLLAIVILVATTIAFTPLKRLMPGYGDGSTHPIVLQLNEQIDSLEEELAAQKLYSDNFRRILVGDFETGMDEEMNDTEIPDSLLNVPRIEEDELLRREIEMNDKVEEQALLSKTVNFLPKETPLEQMYFISPIRGQVSARHMPEKKHYGVDIMAPKNTAVKAILDGFVITSDWTLETGNTIGIQHANNVISFYKHNSVLLKEVGSFVKAGEAVAIIGDTGTLSDGPHLHFELWYKGKPVDPTKYIQF